MDSIAVNVRTAFALLPFLVLLSCGDSFLPHEPSTHAHTGFASQEDEEARYMIPPNARSRWDAPWWQMTSTELADSIEAYNGFAFVGFKEIGAKGGVDDWGQVLVTPATIQQGADFLKSMGLEIEHRSVLMPVVVVRVSREIVPVIRAHPIIDYIEPVGQVWYEAQDTTWNVWRVRAPEAWTTSTGAGVKLLVIDSGVDGQHPDLSPTVIQACDGSNGLDQSGHGTHVAGIAAAVNNSVHLIGVSHGVQLWSSKINFSGANVHCAIEFGRINKVHIINMSFATTESAALTDMIKGAYSDGIFMSKSAGNTNGGEVTYPGNLFETVAVTALDSSNQRAAFAAISNHIELAAPGVSILSTSLPGGTSCTQGGFVAYCSGTSMAAPHVAAAAAILKAYNPSWSNGDIRNRLQSTAIDLGAPGKDPEYGYGLVDIRGALDWQAPPPDITDVTILGTDQIEAHMACSWTAVVTGGVPPFNYSWRVNQQSVGDNSDTLHYTNQGFSFTIEVTVTDQNNSIEFGMLMVNVVQNMWCN